MGMCFSIARFICLRHFGKLTFETVAFTSACIYLDVGEWVRTRSIRTAIMTECLVYKNDETT